MTNLTPTEQIAEARKVLEDLDEKGFLMSSYKEPAIYGTISLALRILERVDEGFIVKVLNQERHTYGAGGESIKETPSHILAVLIITAMVKETN